MKQNKSSKKKLVSSFLVWECEGLLKYDSKYRSQKERLVTSVQRYNTIKIEEMETS